VLAILGAHPLTLFASFTAFIVGFSFILGKAFSDIFSGLMVVMVQRPCKLHLSTCLSLEGLLYHFRPHPLVHRRHWRSHICHQSLPGHTSQRYAWMGCEGPNNLFDDSSVRVNERSR
jgi:hypothetical protein